LIVKKSEIYKRALFWLLKQHVDNRPGESFVTKMMEYEEIRDRLETLKYQLAYLANSLSQSESRLQDSLERADITQQGAKSLTEKFGRIARDLDEAEEGLKNVYKRLLTENTTDKKECLEERHQAFKSGQDERQGIRVGNEVE